MATTTIYGSQPLAKDAIFQQGANSTAGVGGLAQGNSTSYAITAGDGGLAQGFAYGGAITAAKGGLARGYTYGGAITAAAGGQSQGFALGGVITAAEGGLAQGYAYTDSITADTGGFAQGYAKYAITAANGGHAQGYAQGGAITAANGGFAQGYAYGAAITAAEGGLAQGYASYGAITAGVGAFAHGYANAAIVASAQNSAQFGPGTNATASSLQVGSITGSAGVHLKATTNAIEAGDDLTIETPANKTLVLEQPVWDDYITPLGPNNWNGATNNPVLTKLFDDGSSSQGVYAFVFTDGDEALITAQMPHKWKEGTTIEPHIHFMATSDVSPADNFGIEFEYIWADIGEDFPANSTLSTIDISTGVNTDNMHQVGHVTAAGIDGTGHTLSSILLCRIKRVAATGDNYAGGIAILDFDIHFEIDTLGSRQETVK